MNTLWHALEKCLHEGADVPVGVSYTCACESACCLVLRVLTLSDFCVK